MFLAVAFLNEACMSWKQQNGPRVLETSLKNKKDGGRVAEEFVLAQFPRRFLEISLRCLPLTGSGQIQRKTNKQTKSCYRIAWFKRLVFKKQTRDVTISGGTVRYFFGFNLSVKFYASENPFKNGECLFGF